MAERKERTEVLVGIFVFAGFVLLSWLILFFRKSDESYSEVYYFSVAFEDASGVVEGTPVKLAGAAVGHVDGQPKLESGIAPRARVPLAIDRRRELPSNAIFRIESATLLGDKVITITIPDEPSSKVIAEGETIAGSGVGGLDAIQKDVVATASEARLLMDDARESLTQFDAALSDIRTVAGNLDETVSQLNTGVLSDENVASVRRIILNVEDASVGARNASGDFGSVLEEARTAMQELTVLSEQAEKTFQNIDRQLAEIGPAVQEVPETMSSIRRAADRAEGAIGEAEKTFSGINEGEGLVGTLTNDEQARDDTKTFLRNLRRHGILGYKDEATAEDDPRERYRGRRR
jgi:phospholipid/cholesterol/gamma-HCH transport system substrate-binding protein